MHLPGLFIFIVLLSISSARAQDVAPIAEVIEAFKAEIREVQTRDPGDCLLRIKGVELRFDASRRINATANTGARVEAFGVALGASGEIAHTQSDASTIRISLAPFAEPDGGMFDVSDDGITSFAELIAHTKAELEAAADSEPRFRVDAVVIETAFAVERGEEGKLTIAIVGGGGSRTAGSGNRVTLTMAPPEAGSC